MDTATPTAQAMPVGTILCTAGRAFFEVVRATPKTVWVKGLREKTGRTPSGSWAITPIRGAYVHDKPMRFRCNPDDGFVKIGNYRCYPYTGFVWES